MKTLDISSLFITEKKLNEFYDQIDIDKEANPEKIKIGSCLDYAYQSPRLITTTRHNKVLIFDSAQNYYQSEKAMIFVGSEFAELIRLSKQPFSDNWVAECEEYRKNIDEWDEYKYDVAFKANWLKFNQNQDLAKELLRTGNRPLIVRENDRWSNVNAKILTVIREDLRQVNNNNE